MSSSFKAVLSYDGTNYFGWQKTSTGPSIQEEFAKAILLITQEVVIPEAASRTDRGVHAVGQVVQFTLEKSIDPHTLKNRLNAVLPADIRVIDLIVCQFHPTLDSVGKIYHYQMCLDPILDPTKVRYFWHFYYPQDLERLRMAAKQLIGTHDFSAFANEEENRPKLNPICTVESIEFENGLFTIQGDRFLYKMVRNIVGTLAYIGCGKLPKDSIKSILHLRDRKKAGVTAPAHGLYLHQVLYPL
ncbi:MAG: tRNA pseudouridine(38-40) synthase TruA [Chlamydiae bacterium CG10_big_fil_rev_8_21_14_0_10_42_34]|nr:MAG: tRNA pseudouridine(38-40) synthase TruA [Chlamydiae bacterium CG10_big_fil_rev_8_21_14_0_10_42_34]